MLSLGQCWGRLWLCQAKSDCWYLWCVVHGMSCKAAAPTGIAAANIEIDGTDICAATLHSVFDLDAEYQSNLDFAKPGRSSCFDIDRGSMRMCVPGVGGVVNWSAGVDKVAAILRMKARWARIL